MHARARELIESLDLVPHPEGGFYRETFRSLRRVRTPEGLERSALTTIEFLLVDRGHSRWHRVLQDEIWSFHEGAPLELFVLSPAGLERVPLGPPSGDTRPTWVVPASHWQAARTTGDYTRVGCAMGPGFEFEEFTLMRDDPETSAKLRARHPELAELI
jgi:predicted cupin superfamily sugar epimerase